MQKIAKNCKKLQKMRLTLDPDAVSVGERCRMAHDYGLCHGSQLQWFYDHRSQLCRSFQYSGCGGNANRFDTYGACSVVCSDLNITTTSPKATTHAAPYQPKYIHPEAPDAGSQPEVINKGAASFVKWRMCFALLC